jgi:protein-disulfide isomerase
MPRSLEESTLTVPVSETRDHIRGPRSAQVTLLEYGDFECPHCGQAHLVLEQLQDRMNDKYRFVFRHFPLAQAHPHAERAAEAAEAAGAQGRFWRMHDALFENQDRLDDSSLQEYALDLGLDVRRFVEEITDGIHTPRVREDFMSGVRSGVNGTPTFFINGRRHDGPWDLESLTLAIVGELE